MERKVHSENFWVSDYELNLELSVYAKDDDPFSTTKDANRYDIDSNAMLLGNTILPQKLPISK
jgi:hypothetical protein